MGRASRGVKSIKLSKGEKVVDADVIKENKDLLTVMEKGIGKVSSLDEYRPQRRGGKGLKLGTINQKT